MFPWSVMPSAGWPSATAAATRSPTRAAPSNMENSVWVCRCVNDRSDTGPPLVVVLTPVSFVRDSAIYSAAASRREIAGGWRDSKVGARPARLACRGKPPLAHLLELGSGGHLL